MRGLAGLFVVAVAFCVFDEGDLANVACARPSPTPWMAGRGRVALCSTVLDCCGNLSRLPAPHASPCAFFNSLQARPAISR